MKEGRAGSKMKRASLSDIGGEGSKDELEALFEQKKIEGRFGKKTLTVWARKIAKFV
jgi:hypothetical protein